MPEIEYVVNADHAEAINGKLYLHGAGWTDLQQATGPAGQPAIVHLGIAVSILIGWNETNRRFPLKVTLTHEDGAEVARVDAQVEAGRPPGIHPVSQDRRLSALRRVERPEEDRHVPRAPSRSSRWSRRATASSGIVGVSHSAPSRVIRTGWNQSAYRSSCAEAQRGDRDRYGLGQLLRHLGVDVGSKRAGRVAEDLRRP